VKDNEPKPAVTFFSADGVELSARAFYHPDFVDRFVRALAIEAAREDHRAWMEKGKRKKHRKRVLVPPGEKKRP